MLIDYKCPKCGTLFRKVAVGFVCGCAMVAALFHGGPHTELKWPAQPLAQQVIVVSTPSTAPITFDGTSSRAK